jgi:thymidylate synthase (FAD)
MIAIKPFAEILDVDIGKDVLQKIEWIGRTCYKSADKITDESAEKFVANLIKRGHEAMLEHASFCFKVDRSTWFNLRITASHLETFGFKSFLRFTCDYIEGEDRPLVSGNVRAWRDFFKAYHDTYKMLHYGFGKFIQENPVLFPEWQDAYFARGLIDGDFIHIGTDDLKTVNEYMTHCDVTVRFVVDRGISHEIVRHRLGSFAQESTRYCNYAKDKFGGQITFIIPEAFKYGSDEWKMWKEQMESAENTYLTMIDKGVSPEWARGVLGANLKTELIMTANCAEWKHFFNLRACNSTGKAHPQMLEVSRPLLDSFKNTVSIVFDGLTYKE